MMGFQRVDLGDWTEYRKLPGCIEVDFHQSSYGPRKIDYREAMDRVYMTALRALQDAHARGLRCVLMTHEWSTSRRGQTTARSEIRNLMRNKEASPFVIKAQCLQHDSVFVVALRPNPSQLEPVVLVCPRCGTDQVTRKAASRSFQVPAARRQPAAPTTGCRVGGQPSEFTWLEVAVPETWKS